MDIDSTEDPVVTVRYLTGILLACLAPFAAKHSGKETLVVEKDLNLRSLPTSYMLCFGPVFRL